MVNIKLFLLMLATIVTTSGCTTLPSLTAKLNSTPDCCANINQMQFNQKIPIEEAVSFTLDTDSPAFTFPTGKSYFAAFSLPPTAPGKQLQIQTYPTGSDAFESRTYGQIFCPRVSFYNAEKQLLSTLEASGQFDLFKDFGRLKRGSGSSFTIPSEAAFAIVHANPATFGILRAMPTSGGAYMVGNALVIDRGGEYFYFPCAPIADARIRVR